MNSGQSIEKGDIIQVLWLEFHTKLKAFIMARVRDEAVTEDILQEVFIRIHSNIDKLKDDSKLQACIYQITCNLITDYFNKIKRENKLPVVSEKEEEDFSTEYMSEALRDMVNMMDDLPPEYCEALCLTELGSPCLFDCRTSDDFACNGRRLGYFQQKSFSVVFKLLHPGGAS